jgi:hypothetical protein
MSALSLFFIIIPVTQEYTLIEIFKTVLLAYNFLICVLFYTILGTKWMMPRKMHYFLRNSIYLIVKETAFGLMFSYLVLIQMIISDYSSPLWSRFIILIAFLLTSLPILVFIVYKQIKIISCAVVHGTSINTTPFKCFFSGLKMQAGCLYYFNFLFLRRLLNLVCCFLHISPKTKTESEIGFTDTYQLWMFLVIEACWGLYLMFYRPFRVPKINGAEVVGQMWVIGHVVVRLVWYTKFEWTSKVATAAGIMMFPIGHVGIVILCACQRVCRRKRKEEVIYRKFNRIDLSTGRYSLTPLITINP